MRAYFSHFYGELGKGSRQYLKIHGEKKFEEINYRESQK